MADPKKDEEKKIKEVSKDFQLELKKFSSRLKKPRLTLMKLDEMKLKLEDIKSPSDEEKDKLKKVDLSREAIRKMMLKEMLSTNKRLDLILKQKVPPLKKPTPAWQKGFVGGVYDCFKRDPGLKIGKDLFFGCDVSLTKKKVYLELKYKF